MNENNVNEGIPFSAIVHLFVVLNFISFGYVFYSFGFHANFSSIIAIIYFVFGLWSFKKVWI